MSPEYVDPSAKTKRRRPAAPSIPSIPSRLELLNAGYCLDATRQPAILPAILDPFAEGAAPAVMIQIALDWIIDVPVLNQLFQETAVDQYTREWALEHLVQVMLDVTCGFRPSGTNARPIHRLGVRRVVDQRRNALCSPAGFPMKWKILASDSMRKKTNSSMNRVPVLTPIK